MRLSILFTALFLFFSSTNSNAQSLGAHPSSIDWKSIDSKNVRVIFPKGTDVQAKRIADVINYINRYATTSVGSKSKKLDLVLQTQQVISNGFVTLSPFRSEFFATGFQNFTSLGSTNWLDLLAVHEYRHALQYANSNRGATKFMHIISGQNGWAAALNLSIPAWYLEGDAVLSETLLSHNGRGRNPFFYKEQRALLLDNTIYAYAKARNGSYKDLVPNRYPLGFAITNHIRNTYGIEKGREILADAGRYKYIIYPFSNAMKAHTGLSTTKMYNEAYLKLQNKWKKESDALQITKSELIATPVKKTVTDYTFANYLNDKSIVAIKKSYKETPRLIRIYNSKEQKLTTIGISPQEFLSVKNNKVAWTEYQKDIRRNNKNYSNIVTYNFDTGIKNTLTKNSKLFSPEFSNTSKQIVAVRSDKNIQHNIVLLDAKSGKINKEIPNSLNDFISYPKWNYNDTAIYYLVKRNSRIAFFEFNIEKETTSQISDWTTHTIGAYTLSKDAIYFTASFSGIDNIYSLNLLSGSKNIKQITSVKVGAYMPSIKKNSEELVYSEFTKKGYELHTINLKDKENPTFKMPAFDTKHKIKTTTNEHAILDSIPSGNYDIENYKGFLKGLKLHSWGFSNETNSLNNYGLTLKFQNILSDFSANLDFLYNQNEETNAIFSNITYSKYFLELNLKSSQLDRNNITRSTTNLISNSFIETIFGGGISLPLSKVKGNYTQSMRFSSNYLYHNLSKFKTTNTTPSASLDFGAIESKLTVSNLRRTAFQNLAPRFGQYIDITHKKSTNTVSADKIAVNSILFFPGLLKNHSTRIDFNWRKELLSNDYRFSDTFNYARGYDDVWNNEVSKLSFNYQFPLLYPDLGIWGLTYFKRIRANLFYDTSSIKTHLLHGVVNSSNTVLLPVTLKQNSYGAEILFDNILLNVLPVTIGLRNSFLSEIDIFSPKKKHKFEVFLILNF